MDSAVSVMSWSRRVGGANILDRFAKWCLVGAAARVRSRDSA